MRRSTLTWARHPGIPWVMRRWEVFGGIGLTIIVGVVVWYLLVPRSGLSAHVARGDGSSFSSKTFYEATVENHRGHRAPFTCHVQAMANGVEVASDWFWTPR